jgi:hypothetical protein
MTDGARVPAAGGRDVVLRLTVRADGTADLTTGVDRVAVVKILRDHLAAFEAELDLAGQVFDASRHKK